MATGDDEERFRALYQAEATSILGYALRRVGRDSAHDVVADTFLVAWRRMDQVPEGRAGRLWLYGVARRVLANHRRGDARRTRLGERLRAELAVVLPDGWEDRGHEVTVVRQAVAALDEVDRELLLLTTWEGLTPSEVAEVLDLTPVAVRSRLHRARRRLAAQLEASGGAQRSPAAGHVRKEEHTLLPDPKEAT